MRKFNFQLHFFHKSKELPNFYLLFHIKDLSRNKFKQLLIWNVVVVANHTLPKVVESDIFNDFKWSYLENRKRFFNKIWDTFLSSDRLTKNTKLGIYLLGHLSYELPNIEAAAVSAILNPSFFIATWLCSEAMLKIMQPCTLTFTKNRQNFGSSPHQLIVFV